ncbi:MAG: fumarylacetoacetate hydrolase family protein [Chromatiales bacterium]|nr:fumarylacetoacetate hydrolase family protein [Chromatiales bacterium]
MYLTQHLTTHGARWAVDGFYLPEGLTLGTLLQLPRESIEDVLAATRTEIAAGDPLLPPVEHDQEVWAAGVTYMRSREARMAESDTADIYDKVYDAERAEVFFKAPGYRARGHGQPIRVRRDSHWNVPEPELSIVVNGAREVVGYTAGNDVSSRDIEGANPLYLPQAKVYDGSCALGAGIVIAGPDEQRDLAIRMSIARGGRLEFEGETSTSQLKRTIEELAECLTRELAFPRGVILMTGTCLVPPDAFTLTPGDVVRIEVGEVSLENAVGA